MLKGTREPEVAPRVLLSLMLVAGLAPTTTAVKLKVGETWGPTTQIAIRRRWLPSMREQVRSGSQQGAVRSS